MVGNYTGVRVDHVFIVLYISLVSAGVELRGRQCGPLVHCFMYCLVQVFVESHAGGRVDHVLIVLYIVSCRCWWEATRAAAWTTCSRAVSRGLT